MRNATRKIIMATMGCFLGLCLFSTLSGAAMVAVPEVVSGKIVQLNADHSVKLDNGMIYQPSRQGLTVSVPVGAPVTLRYVVDGSEQRVFFEYAPGLDALSPLPPSIPSAEDRENK